MNYSEIIIRVDTNELETACAVVTSLSDDGMFIEDYSDLLQTLPQAGWSDVIDETLLDRIRQPACIHLYLPDTQNVAELCGDLRNLLDCAGLSYDIETAQIQDTGWTENWKQYYKPEHIGSLVVCPCWEQYQPALGETVLLLDPGMAFGTGQHETTRLSLKLLQNYLKRGDTVLDMGCGSGILSIAALQLGAAHATACDIDSAAVDTACKNAALNHFGTNVYCGICADVMQQQLSGTYSLIIANIVSDVILAAGRFFEGMLNPNGILIVSGIIQARASFVCSQLTGFGLTLLETSRMGDWWSFALRRSR